jgi:hypothetical protein
VSKHMWQGFGVVISARNLCNFGKHGPGFVNILFSYFLMEEEGRTCEEILHMGGNKATCVELHFIPHVWSIHPQQGRK